MTIEITLEERIEEARAKLRTAWLQYQQASAPALESMRLKWEERRRELNILLTQKTDQ